MKVNAVSRWEHSTHGRIVRGLSQLSFHAPLVARPCAIRFLQQMSIEIGG